jgi:hypothetical protein
MDVYVLLVGEEGPDRYVQGVYGTVEEAQAAHEYGPWERVSASFPVWQNHHRWLNDAAGRIEQHEVLTGV